MRSSPPPDARIPPPPAEMLARLAALSQDFAGSFQPATLVERTARALTDLLAPDRLAVLLLDPDANRPRLAYDRGPTPTSVDDPLLQLASRAGPLRFGSNARAIELGVDVAHAPASWIGVPLVAVGRTIGAVSLGADRTEAWTDTDLLVASAVAAQAAVALENSRLFELLSIGKREWELTVDTIAQAICIVDAHGAVRRANRAFADLVHAPVTALPRRPWIGLVPPPWAEPVARALDHPGAPPVELRAGERLLLVSAYPTALAGAVLVFEDVSDKRRLQDQLIQSEKMSAIGQLIAGVAHDLNNPLASVVGFSDFLAESAAVPPGMVEPLRVIRQEAERAATIVHNLLGFARRHEARRERQDLAPLLESTIALLRAELVAHHADAALEVDPDLPAVEINPNQMKQVFVNLLNNATQAIASTGRPGTIRVHARRGAAGAAVVSVSDDGPGIPANIVDHIFEPFFTTKPEGSGTGLGLSICQGILKEHGGRLTYERRSGGGATFVLELPEMAAAETPAAPVAVTEPARSGLRLLVVDDEAPILHYMQATLQAWGHEVVVAADGEQAFAHANAAPFDLVICDLRMPRVGGRELYERLARERPDVAAKVVFATGDTVRGDTLAFLERLGRPYLRKPFTLAELRRVLAGAD